ncbi:Uncharacterised protein [Orientia tsutsugamushi]|uniref:Uncharacterized protein n=1 Tax=Orientia tsutsugamushi TaxID=784 RepID=A0A2U3QZI2_ORITS|nr:Uncharacterised protein [Orientia tsutsugamushi]
MLSFYILDLLTPSRSALSHLYALLYCVTSSFSLSIEIFVGAMFQFFNGDVFLLHTNTVFFSITKCFDVNSKLTFSLDFIVSTFFQKSIEHVILINFSITS